MTAPAEVARHSRAGGAHLRTPVVQRERHQGAVAAGFVTVVDPRGWPVHFLYVGDSGRRTEGDNIFGYCGPCLRDARTECVVVFGVSLRWTRELPAL